MKIIVALALLAATASAFTPARVAMRSRAALRPLRAEDGEAAPVVEGETETEAEAVEEPVPEPPAPKMTAVEYMETMYGGVGNPETGGKIPPMAYSVAKLGTPATMDFMRAAELKHGRIAMMGSFGWIVNLLNIHFPGYLSKTMDITFESLDSVNPVDAFFGLPVEALGQIFAFAAVFEFYEMTHVDGKWAGNNVLDGKTITPNMNKWDILGFTEGKSEDDLAKAKLQELKNGRLAMIGTLGFVAAATIPGSVPFLAGTTF